MSIRVITDTGGRKSRRASQAEWMKHYAQGGQQGRIKMLRRIEEMKKRDQSRSKA